jgi:hypothetical protein
LVQRCATNTSQSARQAAARASPGSGPADSGIVGDACGVQLWQPFSKRPSGAKARIWTSVDGLAIRTSIDRVAVRTSVNGVGNRSSVAVAVQQPGARDLHRGSPADG